MQTCCSATAPLQGWMYSLSSPLHFKYLKSGGELEEEKKKKKRRMSVTVRQRWPFIQHTGGHGAVNKRSRKKKAETDPISSLREHDRGIKAILKFNGPCRFPSTCNLSQAARSIRWKQPVLELLYCCCYCIPHNAALLQEALASVCVCPLSSSGTRVIP